MSYGDNSRYTNDYYGYDDRNGLDYSNAYGNVEEPDPYVDEYQYNSEPSGGDWAVEAGIVWDDSRNKGHHQSFLDSPQSRPHSRSNRGKRDFTIQPDKIPVPSPSYLSVTEQPSIRLTDPTQTRKLLILDLNGTLLYREARLPNNSRDPYSLPEPRPLRPTHTRPYIPSFKAFLFHPNTRKWLDTMVWSSAQYPNVKDMVGKCFGMEQVAEYAEHVEAPQGAAEDTKSQRDGLVAIWDRAFLGLNEMQYKNKTQTTKNLAKPWDLLPLSSFSGPTKALSQAWDNVAAETSNSDSSNVESKSRHISTLASLIEQSHLTRNDLLTHSAQSTLLLDDSPLKARMQPYNHICVPEYERKLYARDLRIMEARSRVNPPENNDLPAETDHQTDFNDAGAGIGKRKRSYSPTPPISLPRKRNKKGIAYGDAKILSKHHDHILLAVIGLLDALKNESNVAAWVKSEGLFAIERMELDDVDSRLVEGDLEAQKVVEQKDKELDTLYRDSVPEGIESAIPSGGKKKKERRRRKRRDATSGVSAMSLESLTDASMASMAHFGSGNDIGVTVDADTDDDVSSRPLTPLPPSQSQATEPSSCLGSPDTSYCSGTTTLPASPPSAARRREIARKIHLLPRLERRSVPHQPRPPTPNFIDSGYLYGTDGDASSQSELVSTSNLNVAEGRNYSGNSRDWSVDDIFSDPPASPPGLNASNFADPTPSFGADTSLIPKAPINALPSLWYQHPPARWYWVRRGVLALKELGLEIIPGVEVD